MTFEQMLLDLQKIATFAIPAILAITLHEAAHGYIALRRGDDTALMLGRVTLNPLKHIDPIGTILLPGILLITGAPFLFGYAKPVPVNFARLMNPLKDMVKVALAGPGMNLFLAIVSALLLYLVIPTIPPNEILGLSGEASTLSIKDNIPFFLTYLDYSSMHNLFIDQLKLDALQVHLLIALGFSIKINMLLAFFNMLPIPPLDGGRVAVGLLPTNLAIKLARIEPFGFFIIIGFLFLPSLIGLPQITAYVIGYPVYFLVNLVYTITGHPAPIL